MVPEKGVQICFQSQQAAVFSKKAPVKWLYNTCETLEVLLETKQRLEILMVRLVSRFHDDNNQLSVTMDA